MKKTMSLNRPVAATGVVRCPRSGFTLMEILIVVSILITLAAIVVVMGQGMLMSTKTKATKALFQRLNLGIEEYRSLTGSYPPDGIDTTVKNDQGIEVKSGAALYHALSNSFKYRVMIGGLPREMTHEPLLKLNDSELIDVSDYPGVIEISDPFGVPIHYDNTQNRRFVPQDGSVHYPPVDEDDHPADPRTLEVSQGGVARPETVQSDRYDMWSDGRDDGKVIATWNLKDI